MRLNCGAGPLAFVMVSALLLVCVLLSEHVRPDRSNCPVAKLHSLSRSNSVSLTPLRLGFVCVPREPPHPARAQGVAVAVPLQAATGECPR